MLYYMNSILGAVCAPVRRCPPSRADQSERGVLMGSKRTPEEKKRQLNRLARAAGHLNHVKMMMENDEDCAEVLIQLTAVIAALRGLGKEIINEHMTHCITHAIEDGDLAKVEEFKKAVQKFV